jgi:hypothetical protein
MLTVGPRPSTEKIVVEDARAVTDEVVLRDRGAVADDDRAGVDCGRLAGGRAQQHAAAAVLQLDVPLVHDRRVVETGLRDVEERIRLFAKDLVVERKMLVFLRLRGKVLVVLAKGEHCAGHSDPVAGRDFALVTPPWISPELTT